jgi:hypothetical protein
MLQTSSAGNNFEMATMEDPAAGQSNTPMAQRIEPEVVHETK